MQRIVARLHLNKLRCHQEWDANGHSEPYLWTAFFRADLTTITGEPGTRVETFVPYSSVSGRSLLGPAASDVRAGDEVEIPTTIGFRGAVLDGGEYGQGVVGAACALLEEDSTPDHAIRAGHQAFAAAFHEELNSYVDSRFPFLSPPQAQDVAAMQARVLEKTLDAVRQELSAWDLLKTHDGFLGFGWWLYDYGQLTQLLLQNPATEDFSSRVQSTERRWIPFWPGGWVTEQQDYEVFGRVWVNRTEQPPPEDPLSEFIERYGSALESLKSLDSKIAELRSELRGASSSEERRHLIASIDDLVARVRPGIERAVAQAAMDYRRQRREKQRASFFTPKVMIEPGH